MTVFQLAKQIRRKNEPWQKAIQRARLRYHQNKVGGRPSTWDEIRAAARVAKENALGAAAAARGAAGEAVSTAVERGKGRFDDAGGFDAMKAAATSMVGEAAAKVDSLRATGSAIISHSKLDAVAEFAETAAGRGELIGMAVEKLDEKFNECHHVEDDLQNQITWILEWLISLQTNTATGGLVDPATYNTAMGVSPTARLVELYKRIQEGFTTPVAAVYTEHRGNAQADDVLGVNRPGGSSRSSTELAHTPF
jgi:hypothetical protein